MTRNDPQFLYIILVLPGLLGVTLIGDGLNKIIRDESGGIISVVFGLFFIAAVILVYFFFSDFFPTS